MLKLNIPSFKHIDWETEIEKTSNLDKKLLIQIARAANLLDDIQEEISPQNLAWMIIWTHVFNTLDGARAALLRNSEFSLNLLDRSCMELSLITHAIVSPFIETDESNSEKKELVNDRLAAYAAWCLWKDISVNNRKLEHRNLDPAWDDSIRHEIADDPNKRENYEKLFGKLEIEDPNELRKQRREYEEQLWGFRSQLYEIAKNPDLKPWIDKLELNSIRAKNRKEKWISSYYDLIGESETSVMQRLMKMDVAFGYSLYEETAALAHASTFKNLFIIHDKKAFPRINVTPKIIKPIVERVESNCRSIIVRLAVINKYL